MENRICVSGDTVKFIGFETISDFATICIYDDKVVINPRPMAPVFGHIAVTLNEQKSFKNKGVADLLLKRISENDWFILIDGIYYQMVE